MLVTKDEALIQYLSVILAQLSGFKSLHSSSSYYHSVAGNWRRTEVGVGGERC